MKKFLLCLLLGLCLKSLAYSSDTGVDIAYMNLTGYSTFNVYLIDVDSPDSVSIQFSDNFDFGLCLEETDGSEGAFAACEALEHPPYLGVWQLRVEEGNAYGLYDHFVFENMETGEIIQIGDCKKDSCAHSLSPDGRWLIFETESALMLLDLSQFAEAEAFFLADIYQSHTFWLNETQLLYYQESLQAYFLYDTETALHYPLETVLDRESLTIIIEGADGLAMLPEPVEAIEPPDEIRGFATVWHWRSDGALLYAHDNLVLLWNGESSEDLMSIPGEYDEATQSGGWYVQNIRWSEDETAFVAGFWEYGHYHQPNRYWYYHLESGEYYEVFAGDWAQWLR